MSIILLTNRNPRRKHLLILVTSETRCLLVTIVVNFTPCSFLRVSSEDPITSTTYSVSMTSVIKASCSSTSHALQENTDNIWQSWCISESTGETCTKFWFLFKCTIYLYFAFIFSSPAEASSDGPTADCKTSRPISLCIFVHQRRHYSSALYSISFFEVILRRQARSCKNLPLFFLMSCLKWVKLTCWLHVTQMSSSISTDQGSESHRKKATNTSEKKVHSMKVLHMDSSDLSLLIVT